MENVKIGTEVHMVKIIEGLLYIGKKILLFLFTIWALSILVFYMSRLAPGDPLKSYYGESVERKTTEEKDRAREKLGLGDSIHIQYMRWFEKALQGDFGISLKYKQDVTEVIGDRILNTIILGGIGFILTFAFALGLGLLLSFHEGQWIDKVICKIGSATSSIPIFWVALVLILIFSVNLNILPSSGAYHMGAPYSIKGRILHLILPLSLIVGNHLWYYTYLIRNRLLDEVRKDYVFLAKAKGLSNGEIIVKHCLPNILPSYISIMAISVPHVIGGTYVVEAIFSYPGIGSLSIECAKYHDYNMLMIIVLMTGCVVILANMLGQLLSERIDPRMRRS